MDSTPHGSDSLPPHGHMIPVNDINIYYEEYGAGEPLVLLHGFTLTSQAWKPYVEAFSQHYRMILVDLRGHGRSTNPTNQFTHRQSALDIFALLDALGIEQFSGIGFSGGGGTLLHMATRQPARVQNMVLAASTIYFPEECRRIQEILTPDNPAWDWDELRKRHVYGDDQIRALLTQFHNFKDSYDDMNFTKPYLGTITARTMIVHGDRDPFFPVVIPMEMYAAIPGSSLWIIPNGDHVDLLTGHEAEFTRLILKFLLEGKTVSDPVRL